ncbi:DUF1385 domain-containing protein [Selenomonas sputigena]|uniref:DUF1385 domain-containing protein n=1 Tax=Selenomonas sputigena TaxID=69823 RepID=A0ABV3X6N2_9FIRM
MVGGQAVIEGVMMRAPGRTATAVRLPDGTISVESKAVQSFADRFPIFKKPFLRGTVSLIESLVIGIRSLSWSAKMAGEEEEQLSDRELAGTIALAFVLAAVLFIALPTGAAKLFHTWSDDPIFLNLAEGFLRLFIFFAYIWGISRMKDIQRVFQYHGAEHKTIFCFEAGLPLTSENARQFSRFHPRCGTSFLLIVMLVSIFVFAFLGWPDLWLRITSRIVLLPVVAGISFEAIRLAGRSQNAFVRAFSLPGLWLQRLTTREPDDSMLEVAIESLKASLPEDKIPAGSGNYLADVEKGAGTEDAADSAADAAEEIPAAAAQVEEAQGRDSKAALAADGR